MRWLLLLALFGINDLYAQTSVSTLDEAVELNELAFEQMNFEPASSMKYLKQAGNFFENAPNSIDKIRNIWWTGIAHAELGQCDSAQAFYDLSFSNALLLNEFSIALEIQSSYVMRCLINAGGDYTKAMNLGLLIKERSKKIDDNEVKLKASRLLIDLYWDTKGNDDQILKLAIECDSLAKEIGDTTLMKHGMFDLAFAYGRIGKHKLALESYRKVIILQEATDDYYISATYNNMGGVMSNMGDNDSALYYFQLGEHYSTLQSREDGIAAARLYQGEVYNLKGDYARARDLCTDALDVFREASIIRRQDECAKCLERAYSGLGQKDKAYDYLELHLALKDSLLNETQENELRFLRIDFGHKLNALTDSMEFAMQHEMKEAEISKQKTRSYFLYAGLALTALFAFFIFNRFRITRRQKGIIETQKKVVEEAHEQLTEKNKEILDSINYAKRIQSAILPPAQIFNEALPDSFVLYLPKDIVAGDFYWMEKRDGSVLFAAADCTGHGVPGAMVSVVCNNGLNRSVREHGLSEPGAILDKTREIIIKEFEKSEEDVKDGMDIALCNLYGTTLSYSGAHNPLWIIRKDSNEIETVDANKQPIGKFVNPDPFKTHQILLNKGDIIYIFTDGYADQFGGPKGKKLKASNFKAILLEIKDKPLDEQKQILHDKFLDWKGSLEQLDDVCVIGVRV